jgi:hypothetical protein
MDVRNCKFCKAPATYAPVDRMDSFGIKVYFCHPCSAEYLYFTRGDAPCEKPSSFSLYTVINSKMYRWTVRADDGVQVWHVKKPGIPGVSINQDMTPVVYIKDIETANINPQNIQVKLQTWLPFL